MNLFWSDLSGVQLVDVEEFLAISSPEQQRPSEGHNIDYKEDEPTDLGKTIASFANTSGGLIFVGVKGDKQKHNIPVAIPGASFVGGDVKVRLTGKIMSQITPRPDFEVGVVPVAGASDKAVALIRVREGNYPPYEFRLQDKVHIPIRVMDSDRQASLRDIEQLFSKRAAFSESAEDRTRQFARGALNPAFMQDMNAGPEAGQYGKGYQALGIRPRVPIPVRLDSRFDTNFKALIRSHFTDSDSGQFLYPFISSDSHVTRWQTRFRFEGSLVTLVRHFECTS